MKGGKGGTPSVISDLESSIAALRGSGRSLSDSEQGFFGPRFGHDFSGVQLHTDSQAGTLANSVQAKAFTVGQDVFFGHGEYSPDTGAGKRLMAHELTHVVQQSWRAPAVQRAPKPGRPAPDPQAERAAAVAEAEAIGRRTREQLNEEDKYKLNGRRRKDKEYAWSLGMKDRTRLQKSLEMSPELQREIAVKILFFEGEGKSAYIQTIKNALSEFPSEQVIDILAGRYERPTTEEESAGPSGPELTCDFGKKEILLEYEGEPERTRCMDYMTDPEMNNLFDDNIVGAVGYAVPATTWENVEYDRFKAMEVKYKNGTSELIMLNEIGDFYYGKHVKYRWFTFLKRKNGLVYPVQNDQIFFDETITPRLLAYKKGLKYQSKELKDLYRLLEVAGAHASILGMYGAAVGTFKTSIQAFRRGGPARLPGRPLPGIGVGVSRAQTTIRSTFGKLAGPRTGFEIHACDDSTVVETTGGGVSYPGRSARAVGGAVTDIPAKTIWVHESVISANGITRKWGAKLNLTQVTAHELGHARTGSFSCAEASRAGADLPGLTAAERIGLLDDAVRIGRQEGISVGNLNLPKGYTPPAP